MLICIIYRFMVMEVYDPGLDETMKYYHSGSDMPFNFQLVYIDKTCGGTCVHRLVDAWMQKMPKEGWPNFVVNIG